MSQLIFSLDKTVNEKSSTGGKVYKAIASTAALDRDREVLIPKGAVTEQFMKNPVMLMIHNYKQVPVGKVLSIDVTKEAVSFTFEFADTKEGNELKGLYDTGFMSAFSVGLYPLKSMWVDEQTADQFEVVGTDGSKDTFDMTKYAVKPQRIVLSWELLEISPVPVPSNPEALLIRAKEDVIRKSVEGHLSKGAAQILEHNLDRQIKEIQESFKSGIDNLETLESSNVIEYVKTAVDTEKAWDVMKATASLAKWASSDGTGEKETIDWGTFSRGFAFVDLSNAEKLSSYKFAHHQVLDKELVAVFKGVAKAMASLLSQKDSYGADAADIYAHLEQHYNDAGKTCPAFDADYTEDQIKSIGDGLDWNNSDESSKENEEIEKTLDDADVLDKLDKVLEVFVEFDEVIRLRFALMADTLDTIGSDVKSLALFKEKTIDEPEEKEDENVDSSVEEQLKSLTNFLKS